MCGAGLRITIATGPLLPVPAVMGGAIPRMWLGLAKEFVAGGHRVNIVARAFEGQSREETQGGVRISRRGGFNQSRVLSFDVLRNLPYSLITALHLPPGDIVVTNDFWLPVVVPWFRRTAGAIVVNANRFPKGQFCLYKSAAAIVAASSVVARAIVSQCPALNAKTVVIPNPIDTSVFKPSREAPPGKGRTLLFVGRVHPEKGVHLLVEAFARFSPTRPDWRLQIVGPTAEKQGGGGTDYERDLRRRGSGLPIDWTGPIFDHLRLAETFRSAALFCYPSFAEKGEALPVAPLEAMASGLPVLTSDLECFRDYLDEGETGFVFDHRGSNGVAALEQRLGELAARDSDLARVGALASTRAAAFSYGVVAQRFLGLFERLHGSLR